MSEGEGGREPQVLTDLSTGRPILMSPRRQKRPRDTGPAARKEQVCPFCEGNESLTTKEVDAIRPDRSAPDTAGWRARAFPNLYPAAPCHEVIAEGPEHTTQPSELLEADLRDAVELWRRRLLAAESREGIRSAFWFKNVGAEAGSSIAHNHSQLLGLPMLPPRLELELRQRLDGGCHHCREIESAASEERVIHMGSDHVVLSPRAPKLPYETYLLPLACANELPNDSTPAREDLVLCLQALFRAVQGAFGAAPFNSWLHRIPGEDFHWHVELQPRIGHVAALELGGDMYINAVESRQSAARLRSALDAAPRPGGQ